jgi:phenylpropionate dioxygenase-like ring-hydroxylating dioxygenase large terminal subunit
MTLEADLKSGLWKGVPLVDPERGTISRDVFVDPELYMIEQEQIFARAWLFVGFEDQVRKPGDFFVSRMGEESVILTKDRQEKLHVFLNSCRHRGMKVCRYDDGNTPVFTCPYHGWSYDLSGRLVGVPFFKDAYHSALNKEEIGLIEVAQLANFHGTIWATWDPGAPSFEEYLGDMAPLMAMGLDKPDGTEADIEVISGVQKWILPSNWKFGHENFLSDGYHGRTTHRSVDMLSISPSGQKGRHTTDVDRRERLWFEIAHHGSGMLRLAVDTEDYPYTPAYPDDPIVEEYFRESYLRRQELLGKNARLQGGNGVSIFPNATIGGRVAVWHPNGPDSTAVWRWYTIQRDAPQEVKDLLRHYAMRYAGPAGLTEQDDMENWNYAHPASKGVIARRHPYIYSMGLGYETRGNTDPTLKDFGLAQNSIVTAMGQAGMGPIAPEQNAREAYAFWLALMCAGSWDELRESGQWP